MSVKELLGAAVFFAAAALFLWMLITSIRSLIDQRKTPLKYRPAKVIKKTSSEEDGKKVYLAEFLADGENIVFKMSESEWNGLEEGASGRLFCRRENYLGFETEKLPEEDPDEKNSR